MSEIVAALFILAGLIFDFLGCLGLVRMPDVFTRLQASTKCVTLGTCLILLGTIIGTFPSAASAKALLVGAFVMLTCPTAAHALARGTYKAGTRPAPSVVDKYAEEVAAPKAGGDSNEKA